jgi:AhpC/TSA antioxidant enzyme
MMRRYLLSFAALTTSAVVAYAPLKGVQVAPVKADTSGSVDIGEWLTSATTATSNNKCKMLVFGTYAADFNAVEYGQRLRYYWPLLREKGVTQCAFLLNCQPAAAETLCQLVDLPDSIEVWVDNTGSAARAFGVERGWLPDNADVNPFLKLFGMLWGLGAWATLPAVIGGYLGNPFAGQPWIEDALATGMKQGRWPDNALELADDGTVAQNKFTELPVVGSWPRRPLELATLRLQSMLGISLAHWKELAPDDEALAAGVLTQLGGCLVVDGNDKAVYEWRDPGICAVANFEDILEKL